jgi:hypothetical protein
MSWQGDREFDEIASRHMEHDLDVEMSRMVALTEEPIVRDYLHHVERVAGFSLPPSLDRLFSQHRKYFAVNPIADLDGTKWFKKYSGAMFHSCQGAVTAVLYHQSNLSQLERNVLSFRQLSKLLERLDRTTIGGGKTQKLDFEYQAFVFAFRRSLDYFARGVACLLKQEFPSFRRLPVILERNRDRKWVQDLLIIHGKYVPLLGTFLSDETKRSTRDELAHYCHVPAGCLNVNAKGVCLFGGGEDLREEQRLVEVLNSYIEHLCGILTESFEAIERGYPGIQARCT